MKKKILCFTLVAFVLISSASVFAAYSGSYSFDIGYEVKGTSEHSLENKNTSTTVKAESYHLDYSVSSKKDDFTVSIFRGLFTSYSVSDLLANNKTQTKSFGTVNAHNDYRIRVTKNGGEAFYIVGNGTINQ